MEFTHDEKTVFSKMGKKGGKKSNDNRKKRLGKKYKDYYSEIGKLGGRPKKDLTNKTITAKL